MSADSTTAVRPARLLALEALAASAQDNVPGTSFVSVTVLPDAEPLRTEAATDPLAERADRLQYELREGPCYAAVTDARFVLVNDLRGSAEFPAYGPRAADLGIGAQAAVQLVRDGERAGLNLYSTHVGAFDRNTVQLAELFATHAAMLLGYAEQVEQLGEAVHTRTDIGTAVGILMERFGVDRHRAFEFLSRTSQERNVKVRVLARQIADGSFTSP